VLQLEAQLADRGVTFDLSPEAIDWLAHKGYDRQMGARPLGRVIQQTVKQPLADEVLFGKLRKGGTVKITVETKENGETGLHLEPIEDGPVTPKPEPEEPKVKAKAKPKRKAASATARKAPAEKPTPPKRGGLVPKVPLKTE
jgi:ATP-dependent Clp protease ATP-binding subunit ClpA